MGIFVFVYDIFFYNFIEKYLKYILGGWFIDFNFLKIINMYLSV